MNYIYIILLLILTSITIIGINISIQVPKKIKIISIFSFCILLFRYLSLWILFLSKNITYLYLLKGIFFTNTLIISIIALEEIYILWRNTKVNFNYIIAVCIGMSVLYCYLIYNSLVIVNISKNFLLGYTMVFIDNKIVYYLYAIINIIVLSLILFVLSDNSNEKIGILFIGTASFITIIETIMYILNFMVVPQYLLGEFIWVISLCYLLNKMKINKKHR